MHELAIEVYEDGAGCDEGLNHFKVHIILHTSDGTHLHEGYDQKDQRLL